MQVDGGAGAGGAEHVPLLELLVRRDGPLTAPAQARVTPQLSGLPHGES